LQAQPAKCAQQSATDNSAIFDALQYAAQCSGDHLRRMLLGCNGFDSSTVATLAIAEPVA